MAERQTLAYLGPAGTFTKEAALKRQSKLLRIKPGTDIGLVETGTIPDVLDMVRSGKVNYGVIPNETTVSDVKGAIEAFATGDFSIIGEDNIHVVFGLWTYGVVSDSEISTVISKPEAYPQNSIFLDDPSRSHWTQELDPNLTKSTAAALEYVVKRRDPKIAAIASPRAALDLLDEGRITQDEYRSLACRAGIGNSNNQFTRFATIAQASETIYAADPTDFDATTFILNVGDRPGSLTACLYDLSGVNITKIRSFNRSGGEASFFMTVDGHVTDPQVQISLAYLSRHSRIKILGSYARDAYPNMIPDENPRIEDALEDVKQILRADGFSNHTENAIAFTLKDRPGALRAATAPFEEMGINLTRVDSQHSRRALGEYVFCVTYDNSGLKDKDKLMEAIGKNCLQLVEVTI